MLDSYQTQDPVPWWRESLFVIWPSLVVDWDLLGYVCVLHVHANEGLSMRVFPSWTLTGVASCCAEWMVSFTSGMEISDAEEDRSKTHKRLKRRLFKWRTFFHGTTEDRKLCVQHQTSKRLRQVQFPGATRDFSPRVNSTFVRFCPVKKHSL